MTELKDLLKNGRVSKALTTRQVSQMLKIDQALISKFENGLRRPTRQQVVELCALLGIDENEALLSWLTEKILSEIQDEPLALSALKLAEQKLNPREIPQEIDNQFEKLLAEMASLKAMLGKKD